ncbi:hypothetical protein KIW84_025045 [Lathyrus oleraceus]|uniref:Uncharacterized protein n=1 Tax=Pisum sativum TaxID=3888 RepID=A0A9D4YIE6_PEA|nr:hypothetical protein KIW84_025045 [Pisum sativum]
MESVETPIAEARIEENVRRSTVQRGFPERLQDCELFRDKEVNDDAVWLMNLLEEFGSSEVKIVTLRVNNVFAINLAKNSIAHGGSKYIEMGFHT